MRKSDVYLAARLMIEHFGPEAPAQAATNIELMLARGDEEGADKWRFVWQAIAEIQSAEPVEH